MESNVINNSEASSGNIIQNNNYQYNIFPTYQAQNNFYNNENSNVQNLAKDTSSPADYNGFDNNYYNYQQKLNEQQNYNCYQAGNYYPNNQSYFRQKIGPLLIVLLHSFTPY